MPKNMGHYLSVASFQVGPDTGEPASVPNIWEKQLTPTPAPEGTKFVMLHFTGVDLPGNNRLEVDLGYDTDVFAAGAGEELWTRPINVAPAGTVTIRYVVDGTTSGAATLAGYARGETGIYGTPSNPDYYNQTNPDLFLNDPSYDEPFYETRGICGGINWENVARLVAGSTEEAASSRACILIMMTPDSTEPEGIKPNACSGALIDADLILTAAHCFPAADSLQVASASVTFDFQTDRDGNRPGSYAPRFYKVRRLVRTGWARAEGDTREALDYSILQIETPPGGIGLDPLTLRPDLPLVGDPVFIAHHPQAVVKKVSNRHGDPSATVVGLSYDLYATPMAIQFDADLTSGSSGSPLFDSAGEVLGVNDWSGGCANGALPASVILTDLATDPPPPRGRDVVVVLDRSGSMGLPGSEPGTTKLDQARSAAALFVQLVRVGAGHRCGLVSFSTTSVEDHPLAPADPANKATLTGPAPYTGGLIGALAAGGTTTIGGGLRSGQTQLPAPSLDANIPHILLLTDGLENTTPMISEIEHLLGETRLCIVGFGSEASLDGPLLTRLAREHRGNYTRAGSGLELQKFFVLCFGNIFEGGSAIDPESVLHADRDLADPVDLDVCGEDEITVVVGWNKPSATLDLRLEAPDGTSITRSSAGVRAATGTDWAFLGVSPSAAGAGNGRWQIHVSRGGGTVEFPPPRIEVRYFVSTVVRGGATLRPIIERHLLVTGDTLNPRVVLREPSGALHPEAKVTVTVSAPTQAVGNLLARTGLGALRVVDGDRLDARTSALIQLEESQETPLIDHAAKTFDLYDDGTHDDGAMEPDGIYGNPISDLTRFEGNYSFHVRATYGRGCSAVREATWTIHVKPGIDPGQTGIETEPTGRLPDGRRRYRVRITPRDRYGNLLGPGRRGELGLTPQPGTELLGPVRDRGDGGYEVDIAWQAGSGPGPGLVVAQPGRPPFALCDVSGALIPGGRGRWIVWILLVLMLVLLVLLMLAILLS